MAIYRNGVCVSTGGGSGGTTDYTELENKPKINSIELSGNKSLADLGAASASNLTAHTSDTSNPHSVTKEQIGLANAENTADLDKPVSTATQTELDKKVDIVEGKGLSSNDYTTTEKNKLAGIAAGAEVNVLEAVKDSSGTALTITDKAVQLSKAAVGLGNVDNTADSDKSLAGSQITSGTVAYARLPVGTAASTICAGNDSRLSNARTPTAHASTHATGGSDAITPASIGAQKQYTTATVTLTVAGWSSSSQTVSVSGVTASNLVIVSPEGSSYIAYGTAGVHCTAQASGQLTFACEETPTAALTINVAIFD